VYGFITTSPKSHTKLDAIGASPRQKETAHALAGYVRREKI